jgi:hypothetical protein
MFPILTTGIPLSQKRVLGNAYPETTSATVPKSVSFGYFIDNPNNDLTG